MGSESVICTDGTHLVCADLDALHRFAAGIGLRRAWFQDEGGRNPHYDLTTVGMRRKALRAGARLVTIRETLAVLRAPREGTT